MQGEAQTRGSEPGAKLSTRTWGGVPACSQALQRFRLPVNWLLASPAAQGEQQC